MAGEEAPAPLTLEQVAQTVDGRYVVVGATAEAAWEVLTRMPGAVDLHATQDHRLVRIVRDEMRFVASALGRPEVDSGALDSLLGHDPLVIAVTSSGVARRIAWKLNGTTRFVPEATWHVLERPRAMQAKDIPDEVFLRAVRDAKRISWAVWWDITPLFPGVPFKVLRAKAEKLIRRRLIDGCTCGCRGEFELTFDGSAFLIKHSKENLT